MRLSRIVLLALALAVAASAQRTSGYAISGRYALILSDPPLAQTAEVPSSRSARRARLDSAHATLRSALESRQIMVTGEVQTVLNAVFVTTTPDRVGELQSLPGVIAVLPLRRYRLNLNKAVPLLNGPAAWQTLGGQPNAGRGVKIAIIDTGIDQNHPAFQDSTISAPPGFPICSGINCNFTNNKVIVARSYIQTEAAGTPPNPAADSRPDDYTPRDRVGHGTATSSAAAGNTNAGPRTTISGMAPHAFLGNYKVFGTSAFASDAAIIQAVDDAVNDGMDVLSLSLGGSAFNGPLDTGTGCGASTANAPCDPLAAALQTAVQAGKIVVAAGGNDGLEAVDSSGTTIKGALSTASSPGYAPLAIAVGATTNLHIWVAQVHVGGNAPSPLQTLAAQFGDGPLPNGPLTGPLVDVQSLITDPQACSTIPANSLQGDFVLIERGTCSFAVKVQNAQSAGAIGVILYDSTSEPIIAPGGLTSTQIPAVFISLSDGQAVKSLLASNPGTPVTLDPTPFEYVLTGPPSISSFSSRGPVTGTGGIKPDIAAVGQDLYMATQKLDAQGEMYSPDGYTVADGTSFATPLVAGAAALVKQKNSAWTPGQIKSAIVNNASQSVLGTSGGAFSVLEAGGGLLDANAALKAVVSAEPSNVSFGVLNSAQLPVSQTLQITNLTGATEALTVAVAVTSPDSNAHVSVSPSSISLGAGQGATLTVTLSGSLPQAGEYEGAVTISTGSSTIRIPYLYLMGSGTPYAIIDLDEGPPDFEGTVSQPVTSGGIVFKVIDKYGVPVSGLPVRWAAANRGAGQINGSDAQTDSNGIAGANIILGPTPGNQSFTGTAGGLTMTFIGTARRLPVISNGGVVDAAAFSASGIVPGSYITIFGSNLSDTTDQAIVPALPLNMDAVSVSFDVPSKNISVPGYLYYVSAGQINLQVPWELQGQTSALVKVIVGESISSLMTVPLTSYAPQFFQYQLSGSSTSFVSALDLNNKLITASNPAVRGQIIQLYANGLGPVNNQPESGLPAPSQPLATTTTTPTVTIGGQSAVVSFSGLAPGFTGLYQINVTVPANAPTGIQPVVMTIGGVSSKGGNIAVQ